MKTIENIHPGEILEEEFLKPMELSAYRLAKEIGVPMTRIAQIIKRKRGISPETALRFSAFFGNTPEFWLGIQMEYDLRQERKELRNQLDAIQPYHAASLGRAALHVAEEAVQYVAGKKRGRSKIKRRSGENS